MASFTSRNSKRKTGDYLPKTTKSRRKPIRGNDIEVVITPANLAHRVDRRGRPYAWVRGTLTFQNNQMTRTVMVQHEAYETICHLLNVGSSLKISGYRETIVDKETGKFGGEVFRAKDVLQVFDAKGREICGSTGRVIAGHERAGHYRRQRHGPNNSHVKIVWIPDVVVKGGSGKMAA